MRLVTLLFYIINLYCIYTAIKLYKDGQTAYFIAYASVFAIDKLTMVVIGCNTTRDEPYIALDFLQIGFLVVLDCDIDPHYLEEIMQLKLYSSMLPSMIIQFIFFICIGIVRDNNVSESNQYLAFTNLISLIFLILILIVLIEIKDNDKEQIKNGLNNFLQVSMFFFTLFSLTYFKDSFGINLAYYQIPITIISFLTFLLKKLTTKENNNDIIELALNFLLFFKQLIYKINFQGYTIQIQYISQLVRVGLIIIFCDSYYELFTASTSSIFIIKQICVFTTSIMSAIYFIINFKQFLICLKTQFISIQDESTLKYAIKIFNKRNILTKRFLLHLSDIKYLNHEWELLEDERKQQLKLEFWQGISYQMKLKKHIDFTTDSYFDETRQDIYACSQYLIIENFPDLILDLVKQDLIINKNDLIARYHLGFIFNYTSTIFIKAYQGDNYEINYLFSQLLYLTAFYKEMKQYQTYNPVIILYDLYD